MNQWQWKATLSLYRWSHQLEKKKQQISLLQIRNGWMFLSRAMKFLLGFSEKSHKWVSYHIVTKNFQRVYESSLLHYLYSFQLDNFFPNCDFWPFTYYLFSELPRMSSSVSHSLQWVEVFQVFDNPLLDWARQVFFILVS